PFSYLRLKLYLRAHGLAAEFHDYDWRLPVAQLGSALAERVRAAGRTRVAIVAHSMGGLVARAALALPGTGSVERLVLLGTPTAARSPPCRPCAAPTRWCARWRGSPARHPPRASPRRSSAPFRACMTCCPSLPAATPPICSMRAPGLPPVRSPARH